jgi:MFS family permease
MANDVHRAGGRAVADDQGLWAPLRYRDFALLWSGFVVSHVGDSVQLHAQAWLVTELTRSGLKVGGVALAQAVPRLVLGLFAGVIVDRVDRRRLLLVTQALAMVQSLVFLVLVASGRITYVLVVALAAALGVVDTLNLNARIAMMPTLVPRPLIGRTVALSALGVNVVQIAGPSLAALLIGAFGVTGCFATNAATFVVLLAALVVARPPPGERPARSEGFGSELREGFGFVRARPLLWAAILLAYLHGLFGVSIARLLALYARVVVNTDGRGYGFLAAAAGLGAIVASVVVTARARSEHLPRNIVTAAFAFSLSVGAIALAHGYALSFAMLALLGAGQMAFRSAVTTSIQLETPDRLRGRVISLLTLDFSLWSIGALVSGALADRLAIARARGAGLAVDAAHLPRAAQAWGMQATFLVMSGLCLLSTALLARTILRARLSPVPGAGDNRAPA